MAGLNQSRNSLAHLIIMHTAYITHPACLKHDMGADHPECPARMHAIEDQLIAFGLLDLLARHEAREQAKSSWRASTNPITSNRYFPVRPVPGWFIWMRIRR